MRLRCCNMTVLGMVYAQLCTSKQCCIGWQWWCMVKLLGVLKFVVAMSCWRSCASMLRSLVEGQKNNSARCSEHARCG